MLEVPKPVFPQHLGYEDHYSNSKNAYVIRNQEVEIMIILQLHRIVVSPLYLSTNTQSTASVQ